MKKLSTLLFVLIGASMTMAQTSEEQLSLLSTDASYNAPIHLPKARYFSPHSLSITVGGSYSLLQFQKTMPGITGKGALQPWGVGLGLEYAYYVMPAFGIGIGVNTSMLVNNMPASIGERVQYGAAFLQSQFLYDNAAAGAPTHQLYQNVSTGFRERYSATYLNVPLVLKFSFPVSNNTRMGFNIGAEANFRLAESTSFTGTMERYLVQSSDALVVHTFADNIGDVNGVASGTGQFAGNEIPRSNLEGGTLAKYGLSGVVGVQLTLGINRYNEVIIGADAKLGLMNIGKTKIGDFKNYLDFRNHTEEWVGANGYDGIMTTLAVGRVTPASLSVKVGYVFNMGKSRSERRHDAARSEYLSARSERRVFLLDSLSALKKQNGEEHRMAELAGLQEESVKREITERSRQLSVLLSTNKLERTDADSTVVDTEDKEYGVKGVKRYNVVVASLTTLKAADKVKRQLEKLGYIIFVIPNSIGTHFRVIVASHATRVEAMDALMKIRSRFMPRYDDAWILDLENKNLY